MTEFIDKVKIAMSWVKNSKRILNLREFFIYYLMKMPELNNLPEDKKYLVSMPGLVSGYCARQFMFYAPVFMESYVQGIAEKVFTDKDSQALYKQIFLRAIYSSHFVSGWETYFETDEVYAQKLATIISAVDGKVSFDPNFFSTKTKEHGGNFSLRFKNGSSYILPIDWFEISVFSCKLGLPLLEQKYLNYIQDRDIIDVGAFVGDSSIVLTEYTHKKVVAIEPGAHNYALLQKTLQMNNLQHRIDAYNVALDKEERTVGIVDHGAGSSIIASSDGNSLTTTTLNTLVRGKYERIGLIKMDTEGYEMNILLGCEELIATHKPILLLSIYHSGDQFMNVPLYMQEKFSHLYDFRFIDCNPVHPLSEKVLVCLPKEL